VHAEDLGRAEIDPDGSFKVGQVGTWRITYTVGRFGMDDGGSILVAQRDMTDGGGLQCHSQSEAGFVSASTDGNARLEVGYDAWRYTRPYRGALAVKVRDGSLGPGERVVIKLGDRSGGSPGWQLQTFPESSHEFRILVDPFGTRLFRPIVAHPSIRITHSKPVSLDGLLPSIGRPGEEIPLRIRALDRWANPVPGFKGDVQVRAEPTVIGLSAILHAGDGHWPTVAFGEEGVYRLALRSGELTGHTNPVVISEAPGPIYWADLHGQTQDAIGTGSVQEFFAYARDRALVDAASWQGNDFQVTDESWAEVCARTKEFNEPGRFVAFLGYEWSGPTPLGGDHNIVYLSDDQPILRSSSWLIEDGGGRAWSPISELWHEFGDRSDVMAMAHVGGRYANLDFWDPRFCGLVEVHSNHGTFEWLVKEALRRGLVIGLVAGSDDHSGRPGWSPPLRRGGVRGTVRLDVFGGLTAIYADELTRPALWEALRSRHCYATTGRRPVLDVRSGSSVMGDILKSPGTPEIKVRVVGTAPLADVQILRDETVIYRHELGECDDRWVRVDWSGMRVRSRNRRATWDGSLRVLGGAIREFVPMGFWREGDGIERLSQSELGIKSTTSGDMVGVFLKLSGTDPRIRYQCPLVGAEAKVTELGPTPTAFDAGGLDLSLRFSISSPLGRPESTEFSFKYTGEARGRHAYWVKAMQMDGHGAWSSPIYMGQ
jgi:hypothetical protein